MIGKQNHRQFKLPRPLKRLIYVVKSLPRCAGHGIYNTVQHDGIEFSGYLAFLGLLSLFPFLVFLMALLGLIGGGELGNAFISSWFAKLPRHVVAALEPRVVEILSGPPPSLLTVSILGAIWTASSIVEGLRTVLNRAYHVTTPPAYLWRRMLSILQMIIFSLVAIVAMILFVIIPIMWHGIEAKIGFPLIPRQVAERWGEVIFFGTILALITVVANLYYILPNIKQSIFSVLPGAVLVVALWMLAAQLFTGYLSNFDQVNLIYGSLGGIIAALLFFYISNVIFIFGAEFNYLLTRATGAKIVEREDAEHIDEPGDYDE